MPNVTPENAHEAKVMLQAAASEFQKYEALGKIDWMKLLELFVLQILPLILKFLQPQAPPKV